MSVKCQERQAALACQAGYKECLSEDMLDWVRGQEEMYFEEMEAEAERKYPGFGFTYEKDCPGFEAFLAGDNDMWDGVVEFDDEDDDWGDDDEEDEWEELDEDDDEYIFDAEFLV